MLKHECFVLHRDIVLDDDTYYICIHYDPLPPSRHAVENHAFVGSLLNGRGGPLLSISTRLDVAERKAVRWINVGLPTVARLVSLPLTVQSTSTTTAVPKA